MLYESEHCIYDCERIRIQAKSNPACAARMWRGCPTPPLSTTQAMPLNRITYSVASYRKRFAVRGKISFGKQYKTTWLRNTGRLATQNRPYGNAIQAVWQRHTARFSNRLWHSGLGTTVQQPSTIPPAQCPPVRPDAACEPLAVASRAKHSPSQAMRAPTFIHYISTITHHRLHTLAVVLHPAMPRHSPQRLRLWRQPAWQAIYCGRFSLFFNKL